MAKAEQIMISLTFDELEIVKEGLRKYLHNFKETPAMEESLNKLLDELEDMPCY